MRQARITAIVRPQVTSSLTALAFTIAGELRSAAQSPALEPPHEPGSAEEERDKRRQERD